MEDSRFDVFVSSTWLDLQSEHEAVEMALARISETKYVGMKHFGSHHENTQVVSLDELKRCRVYIGIFGGRYGSGITEAEYRCALEGNLYCLIYFKSEAAIPPEARETDPDRAAQLAALKQELRERHYVREFANADDLRAWVANDLHRCLSEKNSVSLERSHALYQLRRPLDDFVGREQETERLLDALRNGGSANISSISGGGGMGKSELALLVANKLRGEYPDAQLFIEMRGTDINPLDPADALTKCIRAFVGSEEKLPKDFNELAAQYRNLLNGKRVLIILDNANNSAQVRPLLPPKGCSLVVTSRNTITLPKLTRIELDQLQPDEACDLLSSIAPRVVPDVAGEICSLCGYLPLAIRAVGSLLDVAVDLDPFDYLNQLRDERTRLERIGTEGVESGVEASFNLTYERLHPEAASIFRQLAVFPSSFSAQAEETVCQDPKHFHLSDLLRRALVIYDAQSKRYRLHDLMRLFAGKRLEEYQHQNRDALKRHAAYYLDLIKSAGELMSAQEAGSPLRAMTTFDLEWSNIERGQAWAEAHAEDDTDAMQMCLAYPEVGWRFINLRHVRELIRWFEAGLFAARQTRDRAAEARNLINLGRALYTLTGISASAIELFDQALTIAREIGDRHCEGQALGNTGVVFRESGESRRAIEIFEQRLNIARELDDRRGEASALGNMGRAYWTMGQPKRTIEICTQQLEIAREIKDRRLEAQALGNLGQAHTVLRNPQRAIEFYDQSLAIQRELRNRRGEGGALGDLGRAHEALGNIERAVDFFEQSLSIQREVGYLRAQGYALGNLGRMFFKLGDLTRAIEYHEQHLELAREMGDRVGEGLALFNTSKVLHAKGDLSGALKTAADALAIFDRRIEDPHAAQVRKIMARWSRQKRQ